MIILENGDKWIIDAKEIKDMDYTEATQGKVPLTNLEHFVERLCEAYRYDNQNRESLLPRKLTGTEEEERGYWDANFDVFSEVLGSVATITTSNPWSKVYKMPWNDVIVVFVQADGGGYDVERAVKRYDCYTDYLLDALLPQ